MANNFYFGNRSEANLDTCHVDLITVARTLIQFYNVSVIWGWRDEEQQNLAYALGNSTKRFPESKHNHLSENGQPLSMAMDLVPWHNSRPHIRWRNEKEFAQMAGRVLQIADMLDITLIWGGDWDSDDDLYDQSFNDLGHFGLYEEFV